MTKNVKITTFPGLLDLIAPHSCLGCGVLGSILCDRCKSYIIKSQQNICPNCHQAKSASVCDNCHDFPPTYILGTRHGLLDRLVHELKYQSVRALTPVLAELLDASLPPDIPSNTFLVPLPTSTSHVRTRGLDHTLLIAKSLAHRRGWYVSKALERAKNTTQVGSDQKTRLTQADAAYAVSSAFTPDPTATYILLDDVWTTGATMRAAEKKLRASGAKDIRLLVIALSELQTRTSAE